MMFGTDVSGLSTTSATAAAQGLSIVVPLYNEAAGLGFLHERLCGLAKGLKQRYGLACEVVYIDDGSRDDTLRIARGLGADALDVQVVSLSRNFGKEAALMAGLDHARRGAVLFMDGDGQHPPDLVEKLVGYWIDDGYDVVYTAKAHRDNESFLRRLAVHGFYGLINWGARQKFPRTPATSACCRRARWRRCGSFRSAIVSSRASRAGSVSARSASTTSRRPGPTASPHCSPARLVGLSIEGLTSFSVAPLRFASTARGSARFCGLPVRPFDPLGNLDARKIRPRLSFAGDRPDDHRRRAAHHDRHRRRIYREDSSELKARPIYFVAEHSEKRIETEAGSGERTAAE